MFKNAGEILGSVDGPGGSVDRHAAAHELRATETAVTTMAPKKKELLEKHAMEEEQRRQQHGEDVGGGTRLQRS